MTDFSKAFITVNHRLFVKDFETLSKREILLS